MKYIFVLLLVGLIGHRAEAQGFGLGATNPAEAEILFGGDIGKGGLDSPLIYDFGDEQDAVAVCEAVATELRLAARLAERKSPTDQRKVLVEGVENAKRIIEHTNGYQPLTKNALDRASNMNTAISGECRNLENNESRQACLDLETRVASLILSRMYIWILGSIIPLDQKFYIPYRECRTWECVPEQYRDPFITEYARSASALLTFYVPIREYFAMSAYEARAAELVTAWAANDLYLDLFRRNRTFVSVRASLLGTNEKLKRFNTGGSSQFKNANEAVEFTLPEIERAARTLERQFSCWWCRP